MKTNAFVLIALAVLAACTPRSSPEQPAPGAGFDVIIENGRIVDGTGAAWFYGDVAIRGDRIARSRREGCCAARLRASALTLPVSWWRPGSGTSRVTRAGISWAAVMAAWSAR